ncbi:nuclease-related domain-containing protein [Streptomyces sp. NBC_01304]|uniref:nuclease-related domain-containing protein n=1 Tax=Streptomyces sp. NBC_01304 TaxID=2903818 RepID=UPI002E0E6CAD|nr:NERD domain-containing protein [Streptomyces sp. NBC_01304]
MSRPASVLGTPGASAQRRANELRRQELRFQRRRAARWIVVAIVLWVCAAEVAGSVLPTFIDWLAGATAPYALLKRFFEPGAEVQRWTAGAAAERRTAKHLDALARRGWSVLHDRAIPNSRRNLDHLALLPDGLGAVYIDSKSTRGGGKAGLRGDALVLGKTAYPDAIKGVLREAEEASRALRVPVHPVIAIQGASVPGGRLKHSSGLDIVAARDLRALLTAIPHQRNPQALAELTDTADQRLPRYTAG